MATDLGVRQAPGKPPWMGPSFRVQAGGKKGGHEPVGRRRASQPEGELLKLGQEPTSLETPVGEEADSQLTEFIVDAQATDPLEVVSAVLGSGALAEVLGALTARERHIIELRFGLADDVPHTFEEVGRRFGVTRERIRPGLQLSVYLLRQEDLAPGVGLAVKATAEAGLEVAVGNLSTFAARRRGDGLSRTARGLPGRRPWPHRSGGDPR